MIFFSFFGALIMTTTAYLQYGAKWWKGLICAATLFLIGLISISFHTDENSPALGISSALILGSALIGTSSILTLLLRMRLAAQKTIFLVFVLGWLICAVVPVLV